MIFLTVGAQMPFDRLVHSVDLWAWMRARHDVVAQIGETAFRPSCLQWTAFLDPIDYRQRLAEAEVVVTHAGMGTILTALEFGRPIIVLPRRADLRETRNDHQWDTAAALEEAGRVFVARDERQLLASLDRVDERPAPQRIASHASLRLLSALRRFIRGGEEAAVDMPAAAETPAPHPTSFEMPRAEETGRRAA
jgi:UDP-N-acetylglucosamine transferase subunit ALG13